MEPMQSIRTDGATFKPQTTEVTVRFDSSVTDRSRVIALTVFDLLPPANLNAFVDPAELPVEALIELDQPEEVSQNEPAEPELDESTSDCTTEIEEPSRGTRLIREEQDLKLYLGHYWTSPEGKRTRKNSQLVRNQSQAGIEGTRSAKRAGKKIESSYDVLDRADTHLDNKEYEDAIRTYEFALGEFDFTDLDMGNIHYNLGYCYEKRESTHKIEDVRKSISLYNQAIAAFQRLDTPFGNSETEITRQARDKLYSKYEKDL